MDYDLIVIGGGTAGTNATPGKLAIPLLRGHGAFASPD